MTGEVKNRIAVIGAGPAGASAAISAAAMGLGVDWYDKENRPGGKLNDYHQLFPDRESAAAILKHFNGEEDRIEIKKHFGTAITHLNSDDLPLGLWSDGKIAGTADAVIIATGFDYFDARLKEEFGYGIYDHVITTPDLEKILRDDPDQLLTAGLEPTSIAFVHCVGSRDQQIGINYCSRLCCITGIKQAIEVRELFTACRVTNFYIDIRAFGTGYEELFREAQEKYGIRFIRGRVSEASENQQHRIVLKAEDTLLGRPVKLTADWLVLLVGMVPSCTAVKIDEDRYINRDTGFLKPLNSLTGSGLAPDRGIFTAGASTGPMSIPEAIASGRSAAMEAWKFIKNR